MSDIPLLVYHFLMSPKEHLYNKIKIKEERV